jgi:hypothetical protein
MSDGSESNIVKLALSQELGSNAEPLTEDSTALAFTARYRDRLLFDHDVGKWFTWSGTRWQCERTCLAFSWARDLARELAKKAPPKVQLITSKAAFAGNVEKFARSDRAFAVTSDIWDGDSYLLGTPAGTVDLRTACSARRGKKTLSPRPPPSRRPRPPTARDGCSFCMRPPTGTRG